MVALDEIGRQEQNTSRTELKHDPRDEAPAFKVQGDFGFVQTYYKESEL